MDHIKPLSLGELIERLIRRRKIQSKDLAAQTGLSPTAISKILSNTNHPRQAVFRKICELLCETNKEKASLIAAYAGYYSDKVKMDNLVLQEVNMPHAMEAPGRNYLRNRAAAAKLERQLNKLLRTQAVKIKISPSVGKFSTDFLIEHKGESIALECYSGDFNPEGMLRLGSFLQALCESDDCDQAIAIMPKNHGVRHMLLEGGREAMSIDYFADTFLNS